MAYAPTGAKGETHLIKLMKNATFKVNSISNTQRREYYLNR